MSTPNPARAGLARLVAAAFLAALASGASAATTDTTGTAPGRAVPAAAAPAAHDPAAASLRIFVNIPAYRLDAFVGDELVATWPVTVGKPAEPTHAARFQIASVIWNPWWHPPANRRPREKVTAPGPRNPMGRVKLPLRGLYYIHGTAKEEEIGRPTSRGCVRMRNEDVIALTRLVHEHAGPLPEDELARLEGNPRLTRNVRLQRPVQVDVVYEVAEVRDGTLELHRDVYRAERRPLAEAAMAALAEAGVAVDEVDRERLAELAKPEQLRDGPVVVPVAALYVGAEAADTVVATLVGDAGADEAEDAAAVQPATASAAPAGASMGGGDR